MENITEIYFVTSNQSKYREAAKVLQEYGINLKQLKIELDEIQHKDILEIARKKAITAFEKTGKNKHIIVDDTGLFIKNLGGFPGVYSKHVAKTLGVNRISELVKNGKNIATFKSIVAIMGPGMAKPEVFEGNCHGNYLQKPRGKSLSYVPFDNYFVPKGETKTFAQMKLEEKNIFTGRAISFRKLGNWIVDRRTG